LSDEALLALLQPIIDRVRTDVSAVKEPGVGMWRSDDRLTRARLLRHLSGAQLRGAYLIKPGESVVRCAVLDLDDHAKAWPWEEVAAVAARLIRAAGTVGLKANPWSSSSGHGIHLWFLWDAPQDARSVRAALESVLRSCMLKSGTGGLDAGEVEIFPKQDHVPIGGYGNQVWLPLGGVSHPLEPDFVDGTLRPAPLDWLVTMWDVGGWDWAVSDVVPVLPPLPVVADAAPREIITFNEADQSKVGELQGMLSCVQDYSYDVWLKIGFALHEATGGDDRGLGLWDEWSARGPAYESGVCAAKWATMGKGGESKNTIGLGTLRHLAQAGGWQPLVEFEDISVPDVAAQASGAEGVGRDALVQDQPRFERDKEGRILPTTGNIMLAIARPDLIGVHIGYDTFLDELMFAKRVGEWERFTDVEYNRIKCALENHGRGFRPVSRIDVRECVGDIAQRNAFDSARIWLEGLKWDGVPRVDSFLYDYWGAVDTEYTRAVSRYLWTALAGRVMQPGCQADMMPILVGDQGAGKTRCVKALCPSPETFCEVSFDQKDDDVARRLRGVLVAEVAELRGLGTRDEESIKAFVTRQYENWVPKFKEFRTQFARRVILVGTTNDTEFLGDVTGNRRWLPFNVGARAGRSDEDVRPDDAIEFRDRLWAEARERFGVEGVMWEQAQELAVFEHGEFMIGHPWEDAIETWLRDYSEILIDKIDDEIFLTGPQVLSQALGVTGRYTAADGRQLAKVLTKLGFRKTKRLNGSIRGWARRTNDFR